MSKKRKWFFLWCYDEIFWRSWNICELVELYFLNWLTTVIDKSTVGLYSDDGLAAIENANGPKLDRIRKDIIALFKEGGISVTIEIHFIGTDFLDVSFNLATKKYFPFQKANNTPLYINAFYNHSHTIITEFLKIIYKRISGLSSNKEQFDKIISVYKSALKYSGKYSSMSCNNSNTQSARTNRKRKIILFYPSRSQTVKTNIGKLFIKLVRNKFSKNKKYHKIFNLNTLLISTVIAALPMFETSSNNIILKCWAKQITTKKRKCNCRSKPNCPLNGECVIQCLIYKGKSTTSNNNFVYYGTYEVEFKTRYNNHTKSFRHCECMNETEL